MADCEPIYLFSYGTLRLAQVQLTWFGRLLAGSDDVLPGYRTGQLEITDPGVVAASGTRFHPIIEPSAFPADEVQGLVFEVTEAELRAADTYEVADYVRASVTLKSGRKAWTYVRAASAPDLAVLVAAEERAFALLDAIEAGGIIAAGRTELAIERDIFTIAERDFGVREHWHDRVVRAGVNALCLAARDDDCSELQ